MSRKNRYRDEAPKAAEPVLEEGDNPLSSASPTTDPVVEAPQEPPDIEMEPAAESGPAVVETDPAVEECLPAGLVEIEQAKRDLSDDYHDAVQALADKRRHDDEYRRHVHNLAEIAKVQNKLTGGWRAVD